MNTAAASPNRKTSRQKATVIMTSASIEATCFETSTLTDLGHALNVASSAPMSLGRRPHSGRPVT
jgi:hypothetical protein